MFHRHGMAGSAYVCIWYSIYTVDDFLCILHFHPNNYSALLRGFIILYRINHINDERKHRYWVLHKTTYSLFYCTLQNIYIFGIL